MDIENDPRVQQWYSIIEATPNTKKNYNHFIKLFCECVKKTPSQLIDESIGEIKAGLLPSERKVGQYIVQLKNCMTEKGYSPKSFGQGITVVVSFFKVFDIVLPAAIGKQKKRVTLRENQNFLTRDDVIKLVTNAPSLREKAIILCMATSGMARQEILNLKINDIAFENETSIGIVSIRRQKSQTDYVTFISPEAVIALKAYFEERERKPETAIKRKTENVFIKYEGGRMNERTFIKIFQNLGKRLGYENGENFTKSRSHALRKYFATTLENAGFPKNKVDFMLGHTQSGNDAAYFRVDIKALKQLYIKFLPYLTFEKKIEVRSLNTEDAVRLAELEKENVELRKQVKEIKTDLDSRKGADDTLNKLFSDPQVQELLLRKMKELEGKRKS